MKLTEKCYSFSDSDVVYLFDEDTDAVSLLLLPQGMHHSFESRRPDLDSTPDLRRLGLHCPAWHVGSLCHLTIRQHRQLSCSGETLLGGFSTTSMHFLSQDVRESDDSTQIITTLENEEGLQITHTLSHFTDEKGFEVQCTFINNSKEAVELDQFSSFSLDNLTPFSIDDAPCTLRLHRFYGGWSKESRHRADDLEDLNLERPWFNGRGCSERFGSIGSYPVDRYIPFAAVEDKKAHVFWAAQLAHNASWQMELCRFDDCVSFVGGLADCEFGSWFKNILPGQSFDAPKAFLSVSHESLSDACQRITHMHQKYLALQPAVEQNLPVIFNEWCSSWGHPDEAEILRLSEKFEKTPVRYIVIDAGWSKSDIDNLGQGGNGDWILDSGKFPNGLQQLSRTLKKRNQILGIWFEFEVTTRGANVFLPAYDHLHLKRNGELILSGSERSFWDFRKPEVIAYLKERVIAFLRSSEIGYLKVDYNGSIGIGCDGAESPGEGLRQQMAAVRAFFSEIRRELPELVIENCASGGHRMEPSMMDITALTSSSDAHECREIPILAANTDLLILPRQNEVWCVVDDTHSLHELYYRLTAGLLGRMCLSGDVLTISKEKWNVILEACAFYGSCSEILKDCRVSIFRRLKTKSVRYPEGAQAVLLSGRSGSHLLVCHSFADCEDVTLEVPLPETGLRVHSGFGETQYCCIHNGQLSVSGMQPYSSFAILLAFPW